MDGSGIDLDISQEIQVETTQADPGPPPASSTPAKPAKKDRGKTHLCTACGNTYKHLPNLRRHIRATHEEGFQCFICKKALVSQVALESHLNGHEKKKPFSCAACKKTYQSRTSLAQHSCSSKPSQSFPWDECPKVCPSKKALTQHRLKHAPMPEFRCQFCGVEFKFRQGRDRHVKSRCRVAQETKTSKDSYPPLMLQPL
ncbi:gastrula zinc finger protein XlCGF7.1-like [Littorina saxatilis]|uniref:gastrula zinc finger protein XlCGF7.1-like n=1 Tax=Littorina saxatilis TaxID=31220 RepID=UPI0038B4F2A2